jgi:hypothetical protein
MTVTDTAATVAPQQAGDVQSAEQPVTPKPERQPGPMKTRTGAEALVINAPKGTRVFTAGGDKGGKIAELLRTKPEMSRKDIAALVGSSQSRVAEVARVLGIAKARPAKAETGESAPQPRKQRPSAPDRFHLTIVEPPQSPPHCVGLDLFLGTDHYPVGA